MKFAPAQIRELATNTRFSSENLEKVLRLRELLSDLRVPALSLALFLLLSCTRHSCAFRNTLSAKPHPARFLHLY
jgi:hypothetical protein